MYIIYIYCVYIYSVYIYIDLLSEKTPHEIAMAAMNEVVLSRQPKESGSASERGSTPPWRGAPWGTSGPRWVVGTNTILPKKGGGV